MLGPPQAVVGRPRKSWSLPFEEVRERYEHGESLESLATACGFASISPLQRAFREAGVPVRPRGSRRGVARGGKVKRLCKHADCLNEFEVYPSQNKKYCQASCRYSDPALAQLLNRNLSGRHAVSEVDTATGRGVCAVCGPVDVRLRNDGDRAVHTAGTWRCRTAERARVWARKMGVSIEQVEAWLVKQGGLCAICQGDNGGRVLRVDHCHVSVKGRGLLCDSCNLGLGQFGDDPARLRAAAVYLETAS